MDEVKVPKFPLPSTLNEVSHEVGRAREKFPSPRFLLTALMEEVGELSRAYLQDQGPTQIKREAMQCAGLAIRIMEEGDPIYLTITPEEAKP